MLLHLKICFQTVFKSKLMKYVVVIRTKMEASWYGTPARLGNTLCLCSQRVAGE